MIRSMTGYGSAKGVYDKTEISVEIKSVNNRYLDCTLKLPRVYYALEDSLKSIIQNHISRGKVDAYISVDSSRSNDVEIKINRPLAEAYIDALREMARDYNLSFNVSAMDMTRFPDVLQAEKREADTELLYAKIRDVLKDALSGFNEMRVREGKKLHIDISARLTEIESYTDLVEEISPRSTAEYRKKLEIRMNEILQAADIDESRILTEAALFAERVAINEEVVRLRSHIEQLRDLLESVEPVGRKLDFLVQEFNREANTIGSKGNDPEIARIVIALKSEIEKIREQAQNIE